MIQRLFNIFVPTIKPISPIILERKLPFQLDQVKLDAFRKEKAAQEALFRQSPEIGNCFLVATIKSTMFALNEYANKTGEHWYNARNWLRKLVTIGNDGDARVCFPVLGDKHNKFDVCNLDVRFLTGFYPEKNNRVKYLEAAYSMLLSASDKVMKGKYNINSCLDGGYSFLAMRDITGLKSFHLTQHKDTKEQRELFKKYTEILFKTFKEHPENLILTLSTKKEISTDRFLNRHCYSLKKVLNDSLIIVDPHSKTNEEIKVSFDDFYKYFKGVSFARINPEKMFNMLEQAKQTTKKVLNGWIFKDNRNIQVRDSNTSTLKNYVYYNVEDNIH